MPGFAERLDAWVADARIDGAALGRARERWLAEAAAEDATVAGVLADLAERSELAVLATSTGHRYQGHLTGLGVDFVAIRPTAGPERLVAVATLTSVAPLGRTDLGSRAVGTELRLADLLAEMAADRERVLIETAEGDVHRGVLMSVGRDVVVVRSDDEASSRRYLPMDAIVEVVIA